MNPYRTRDVALGSLIATIVVAGAAVMFFRAASAEDRCAEPYTFLSAHVNCTQETEQNARIASLETHVAARIEVAKNSGDATRVGVFYRDLNSRKWFGVNELEPFAPASLLKIPLAIAYYKLAEVDDAVLDKPLVYELHPDEVQPSNAHLVDKQTYPVRAFIEQVLVHSDNDATIVLSNNMREQYEHKVFYDLGVTAPGKDIDSLSPKTYGAIFRSLYNASYLQAAYAEELLASMSRAAFTRGLVAGVPEGTTVAHKFGYRVKEDGTQELHDCGIIYHPDSPFILCIMTEGGDPERLAHVIADITNQIWSTL